MFFKVLVDLNILLNAIFVLETYSRCGCPGLAAYGFTRTALSEKNDICDNICSGVFLECRLWKANGPEKVRPVGQILSRPIFHRVHGVPACDKHKKAARLNPVYGLRKKIIVERKPVFRVFRVRNDLGRSKGWIPDTRIKEISRDFGFCKIVLDDVLIRI